MAVMSNEEIKRDQKEGSKPSSNPNYAAQLYGNMANAATVGNSSMGTQNDIGDYLANQNQQIAEGQTNVPTNTQNQQAQQQAQQTQTTNTNVNPTTSTANYTSANQDGNIDGYYFSKYDLGLNDDVKAQILEAKKGFRQAQLDGNKSLAKKYHEDVQYLRAINGGYIDDKGDGSGYRELGYQTLSPVDKTLPKEAQDLIIRYQIGYLMASTPAEKKQYNQLANEVRSKYGGYSGGATGAEYIKNSPLTDLYQGGGNYSGFNDAMSGLNDLINGNGAGTGTGTGNDAGTGNPVNDANGNTGNPYNVGGIDMTQFLANPELPTYNAPNYQDYIVPYNQLMELAPGYQVINRDNSPYYNPNSQYEDTYNNLMNSMTELANKYQNNVNSQMEYLQGLTGQWNPDTDPVFQQYLQQWQREADANSNRALAQAASNTGGIANSYATSIANQARNAAFANQMPEVYDRLAQNYYDRMRQANDLTGSSLNTAANLYNTLLNNASSTMQNEADRAENRYQFDRGQNLNEYDTIYDNLSKDWQFQNQLGKDYYDTNLSSYDSNYWNTVNRADNNNQWLWEQMYGLGTDNRNYNFAAQQQQIDNNFNLAKLLLNDAQFREQIGQEAWEYLGNMLVDKEKLDMQRDQFKSDQEFQAAQAQLDRDLETYMQQHGFDFEAWKMSQGY